MKLSEWLDVAHLDVCAFSEKIGVWPGTVHRYLRDERVPTPRVMRRIIAFTNAVVGPQDFYGLPGSTTRKRRKRRRRAAVRQAA